ncbi:hypothetical protein [Streptomyces axinellae]
MRISAAVAAVLLTGAALLGSAGSAAAATAPTPGQERAAGSGTALTLPLDLLGLPSLSISAGGR